MTQDDFDTDNDCLVEIWWLEQLNALRWDLDANGHGPSTTGHDAAFPRSNPDPHTVFPVGTQCHPTQSSCVARFGDVSGQCVGYELMRDLDFNDPGSYRSGVVNTEWTTGEGWDPIGAQGASYRGHFAGNGHTVRNLYIDRDRDNLGLFGFYGGGYIAGIGVTGSVTANGSENIATGGLVGQTYNSQIEEVYSTVVVNGHTQVGGVVGFLSGSSDGGGGRLVISYATGPTSGSHEVGGLLGSAVSSTDSTVEHVYATGFVTASRTTGDGGSRLK